MTDHRLENDITTTLGIDGSNVSRGRWLKWLLGLTIVLSVLGVFLLWQASDSTNGVQYKTQEARRGGLIITVSATGNLEPTNQVDVGSELSGIIDNVLVDYNDRVEAGQILAELDTDKLRAEVLQSEAALAAAEAKVKVSQATVLETRLKLQRCQRLAEKKLCAQEELDTDSAAYKRAQAEEGSTRAQVAEARAKLDADQDQPGQDGDPLADRWRSPGEDGRARADCCCLTPGAGTVYSGRRSGGDGTARRCGRGGCGTGS